MKANGHTLQHSNLNRSILIMYAKCGSMTEAHRIFDSICKPDVVSWNALLMGYAQNGQSRTALNLFTRMKAESGCCPNTVTYAAALKSCTSLAAKGSKREGLERGREIHQELRCQQLSDPHIQSSLIDMYAKCSSMSEARRVFDSIEKPDIVCWTALLLGYAANDLGLNALEMFCRMKASKACTPNWLTYIAVLKACTSLAIAGRKAEALKLGKEIHLEIGSSMNVYIQSTLINMYASCGSMVEAQRAFDSLELPDAASWNALLLGYAENGDGRTALDAFFAMTYPPTSVTYLAALKACICLALNGGKQDALAWGRRIHSQMGCYPNTQVQNTLIDMYTKCGSMLEAQQVFNRLRYPDVVSWSILVTGYGEHGDARAALDLFSRMSVTPNAVAYVAAIKACSSLALNGEKRAGLERGRQIHSQIGCTSDLCVQNALIDMYSKCESMNEAQLVFDSLQKPDVVSWTALITGYVENADAGFALELFSRMRMDCEPNSLTYVATLRACSLLAASGEKAVGLSLGRETHAKAGRHLNLYVQNTLVDMYAKCGSMSEARATFEAIEKPDVVSWTSLLMGYVENGEPQRALDLFKPGFKPEWCPNSLTYVALLKACTLVGSLTLGRRFHSIISEFDCHVVTCLVDFYAKSGSLSEAADVFDLHPRVRELSTWSSLLGGYARFGHAGPVLNLFEALESVGFQPNGVTFLCMLICCNHAGLVEQARAYVEAMSARYGVAPDVRHYTCMVDILGRANQLKEAIEVIRGMPCKADTVTWMTLLSAAVKWRDVEVGSWAFRSLLEIDKRSAPAYVLMSQLYESCNMWTEQQTVLEMRKHLEYC